MIMIEISKILLLVACVAVLACGGGDGNEPDPENPAPALTAQGWALFEAGDYAVAITKFDSALVADPAYREANTGLGWSNLRWGVLTEAAIEFTTAKNDAMQLDAFAGNAFLLLAMNDYDQTIDDAETVIAGDAAYVFSHDTDVDVSDMKLLAAFAYFHNNDYAACLDLVLELNPSFDVEASTAELLAELERLQGEIGG